MNSLCGDSHIQEILVGGYSNPKGMETADTDCGLHESEEMFAMMDGSQWTGQGVLEPAILPSDVGWDIRCNQLLVGQTNSRDLYEHRSPPDRGIVHLSSRDVTSQKSSVSTAVRWDKCSKYGFGTVMSEWIYIYAL